MLRKSHQRYAAIGIVAAIHLVLLWFLGKSLQPASFGWTGQELQVTLLSPNLTPGEALAPPLDWTFQEPDEVIVPQPEFTITPDQEAGEGVVGDVMTERLAPRLDPRHLNAPPELPHSLGSYVAAIKLQLRILVLPDGSVGDAQVIKSSGEGDVDRLGIQTVENEWRYLPASINGKPVEAWISVIVRFAAI